MIWRRFSPHDQMNFIHRLHSILQAGLPLLEAFLLLERCSAPHWKPMLAQIIQQLRIGNSLATSLATQSHRFNPICIGLISIGEKTGALERSLSLIYQQLLHQELLKNQMKQALTYPGITLITALLIVSTMFIWVIPSFESIFDHFRGELPLVTQILISIARVIHSQVVTIAIMIFSIGTCLWILWKYSVVFQKWYDHHCFQIPFVGHLLRQSHQIAWCQNIAHLLQSGLSLLESIRICAQSSNHWLSHDLSANLFKQLSMGWDLGSAMRRSDPNRKFFDDETIQLLEIGAQSGMLTSMLDNRSRSLGHQLEHRLGMLRQSLEPLFIIFLGLLVAGLLMALYLPIFSLGRII